MTGERSKGCYLTTTELHRLDIAVQPLLALDSHGVMLVGSVSERPDFRDVDVRLILHDEDFDRLFGHTPELWSVFSYAVSRMLAEVTAPRVTTTTETAPRTIEARPARPRPCDVHGCGRTAVVAMRFRDQLGHVHVCAPCEAADREWCDVAETRPLPCPWPHTMTWVAQPRELA